MKNFVHILISLSLGAGLVTAQKSKADPEMTVIQEEKHDVSPPLYSIAPAPPTAEHGHKHDVGRIPLSGQPTQYQPDPALQSSNVLPASFATPGQSFDGVGVGFGAFSPNVAPPDTNGAVGASQYVQWVNTSFAIFDKTTGAVLSGPTSGNSLWSGFGGDCQNRNDGDPIVQYDKAANRWVMVQFTRANPFLLCFAVSTTSDATGTYNRYSFSFANNLPDYPKISVWPDGYYSSANLFSGGSSFAGGSMCAYNRTAMLAGTAANAVCFTIGSGGSLPADLDGSTAPPAGTPNFFIRFGTNSLNLYKFHADFVTTGNSTLTGPTSIAVSAFTIACPTGSHTCIPQLGTSQQLDALSDRMMYRLAYRKFADHDALVVNHSITGGSSNVGVRWYEIRNPNGVTPTLFQQGTFAPDSNFRWMGSIGMDKVGNIAMGYSVSGTGMKPAIRYTGRIESEPLGLMEPETSLMEGAGAQLPNLSRWGDYSALTIDPSDDCTFWYTNEYLKTDGTFNWSTRISNFKFANCQ